MLFTFVAIDNSGKMIKRIRSNSHCLKNITIFYDINISLRLKYNN